MEAIGSIFDLPINTMGLADQEKLLRERFKYLGGWSFPAEFRAKT